MKPLDSLYGAGSSAQLAAEFKLKGWPKPKIEEVALPDGNVRVNIRWGEAEMKIECSLVSVRYLSLHSGDDEPTGLYTALTATKVPEFFRERGVEYFAATPADEDTEAILRTRGGWKGRDRRGIRWEL